MLLTETNAAVRRAALFALEATDTEATPSPRWETLIRHREPEWIVSGLRLFMHARQRLPAPIRQVAIEHLAHADSEVREAAVEFFRHQPVARLPEAERALVVDALFNLTADPAELVARAAADALATHANAAENAADREVYADCVRANLRHDEVRVREGALLLIERLDLDLVRTGLLERVLAELDSPEQILRRAAAILLGRVQARGFRLFHHPLRLRPLVELIPGVRLPRGDFRA